MKEKRSQWYGDEKQLIRIPVSTNLPNGYGVVCKSLTYAMICTKAIAANSFVCIG